jgi:peptidoglycan hydrolase-like protein with peptidoglycan-binding domain
VRKTFVGGAVLLGVAVGAGLGWSGSVLLGPPERLPASRTFDVIKVDRGTVERSVHLSASATWAGGAPVTNSAAGMLTEQHVRDGATVGVGSTVYSVDLLPVVAMEGNIPLFRDLKPGQTGKDVAQLQRFLVAVGLRESRASGRFDDSTLVQVRKWQRAAGLPVTGAVPMASFVVVPHLPGALAWTQEGAVGLRVAQGVRVARMLPPQPSFAMQLSQSQRTLVRPGMEVVLRTEDVTWRATVRSTGGVDESGATRAFLGPPKGRSSICAPRCSVVSTSRAQSVEATVLVTPARTGSVVPTAALAVDAEGGTAVIDPAGRAIAVSVVASASGRAIVSGVEVGQRVRVPGR